MIGPAPCSCIGIRTSTSTTPSPTHTRLSSVQERLARHNRRRRAPHRINSKQSNSGKLRQVGLGFASGPTVAQRTPRTGGQVGSRLLLPSQNIPIFQWEWQPPITFGRAAKKGADGLAWLGDARLVCSSVLSAIHSLHYCSTTHTAMHLLHSLET